MEPISIQLFSTKVQEFIKEKGIDKDNSGTLDKTELDELQKLLPNNLKNENVGLDTFNSTTTDAVNNDTNVNVPQTENEEPASEVEEDNQDDFERYKEMLGEKIEGPAAKELTKKIFGKLLATSGEGAESAYYRQLQRAQEKAEGDDVSDIEARCESFIKSLEETSANNRAKMMESIAQNNGSVKVLHYGKNNEKTAYVINVLDVRGFSDNDDENSESEDSAKDNDLTQQIANGFSYTMILTGDHFDVYVNADVTKKDGDFTFGGSYQKETPKGNNFSVAGFGSYTAAGFNTGDAADDSIKTNAGVALDYGVKDKLSVGAYALYSKVTTREEDSDGALTPASDTEIVTEGFAKYTPVNNGKQLFAVTGAGSWKKYDYMDIYGGKIYLNYGHQDSNLSANASLTLDGGAYKFNEKELGTAIPTVGYVEAGATGTLKWTTDRFNLAASANGAYTLTIDPSETVLNEKYNSVIRGMGNISATLDQKYKIGASIISQGYSSESADSTSLSKFNNDLGLSISAEIIDFLNSGFSLCGSYSILGMGAGSKTTTPFALITLRKVIGGNK